MPALSTVDNIAFSSSSMIGLTSRCLCFTFDVGVCLLACRVVFTIFLGLTER